MDDKLIPDGQERPNSSQGPTPGKKYASPRELLDEEEDDPSGSDPGDDSMSPEGLGAPFKPMQSWKSWLILGAVFLVIAVAVLYVYQAGDSKTILGNQPIPVAQGVGLGSQVALNAPGGGNLPVIRTRPPSNAPIPPRTAPPDIATPRATGVSPQAMPAVQCNHCGTSGIPVCASCGAVMQPLNQGNGNVQLFVCPVCGQVGIPICPQCGAHMSPSHQMLEQPNQVGNQPTASQSFNRASGQYQCPVCGVIGLPNWDTQGIAHCPSCNAPMSIR